MTFRAPVIQNDLFEGIMSKNEFLEYQAELSLEDRANIVLISISEPFDSEFVSDDKTTVIGFHDVLEMKFWDIEEDFGRYKTLSDRQGVKLRKFIKKNKDKKFLIHCKAGQSRSAGIGHPPCGRPCREGKAAPPRRHRTVPTVPRVALLAPALAEHRWQRRCLH